MPYRTTEVAIALEQPLARRYRPMSWRAWYLGMGLAVSPMLVVVAWGFGRFVGFYVAPTIVADWDDPPSTAVVFAFAWGIAVALGLRWAQRGRAVWIRENSGAVAAFGGGDVAAAAATYDRLCLATRWAPAMHAECVVNRATTLFAAGDVAGSIALQASAARSGWMSARWTSLEMLAAHTRHHATALAVAGDLDQARHLRDIASALPPDGNRAAQLVLDVLLAIVAVDHAGALVVLRGRAAADAALVAGHRKVLDLLHATALLHAGGEGSRAEATALVARAAPLPCPATRTYLDNIPALAACVRELTAQP